MIVNKGKHINPLVLYHAECSIKVAIIICPFMFMISIGL